MMLKNTKVGMIKMMFIKKNTKKMMKRIEDWLKTAAKLTIFL